MSDRTIGNMIGLVDMYCKFWTFLYLDSFTAFRSVMFLRGSESTITLGYSL
jgi:hypothetical protein